MSKIRRFVRRCHLDVPASAVFDWYKKPGATSRLEPPWLDVKFLKHEGIALENGTRIHLEIGSGWLKGELVLEYTNCREGRHFENRQIEGPFGYWNHLNLINEITPNSSEVEDIISYSLPKEILFTKYWINKYISKELKRCFDYRHTTIKHDLLRHQGVRPMKILISGSSGLIGSALIPFLTGGGHEVWKLVRTRANLEEHEVAWDLSRGVINPDLLEGLDAVIHLAGENIADSRWSEEKKKRIEDSRVLGTLVLCRALAKLKNPPKALISASAIGYYGNRGDEILTEESSPGTGFLAEVCKEWEAATEPAKEKGIRVVNLRLGVVLSPKGGALKQLLTPVKWGLGGPIGSGKQYMSWISIDDLLGVINELIQNENVSGPVNAVSPNPVTNKEFIKTLGRVLYRPTFFPLPSFLVKLMFGEMADEMLLSSTRVIPEVLDKQGFQFNYPELEGSLRHLLGKSL